MARGAGQILDDVIAELKRQPGEGGEEVKYTADARRFVLTRAGVQWAVLAARERARMIARAQAAAL
eukprot:9400406-Lingulodinium_polyedra.AAC.1